MKVWTLVETGAFLDASEGDRLHALYQTALDTGMRSGELFGLLWGDVDFDRSTITASRCLPTDTLEGARRSSAMPTADFFVGRT